MTWSVSRTGRSTASGSPKGRGIVESSTVDRAETPLEEDVGAKTVIEAFHNTAAKNASRTAIRTRGDAFSIPFGALRQRVDALAAGLSKLGLKKGDTLALMFPNQF